MLPHPSVDAGKECGWGRTHWPLRSPTGTARHPQGQLSVWSAPRDRMLASPIQRLLARSLCGQPPGQLGAAEPGRWQVLGSHHVAAGPSVQGGLAHKRTTPLRQEKPPSETREQNPLAQADSRTRGHGGRAGSPHPSGGQPPGDGVRGQLSTDAGAALRGPGDRGRAPVRQPVSWFLSLAASPRLVEDFENSELTVAEQGQGHPATPRSGQNTRLQVQRS